MARISAQELAELVPCSPADVRRLDELGLLNRDYADGLFPVEKTERAISVPARMGINAGAVIAQEGDYFGRTVNVAARIAD